MIGKIEPTGALSAFSRWIERMARNPRTSIVPVAEAHRRDTNAQSRFLAEGAATNRVETALRSADIRVKSHEMAHLAVLGGAAAGGIEYRYAIGPDGTRYAVGGSVKVDTEPVPGNPEETLRKAKRIRAAALAPGEPSAADMRIAAEAYRMEVAARKEIEAGRSAAENDLMRNVPTGIDITI